MCPLGRFAAKEGARYACDECGIGHYCDTVNLTVAKVCPDGRVSGINFTAVACAPCKSGSFSDELRATCKRCASGSYRTSANLCGACPRIGVDCVDSALNIQAGFWLPPTAASTFSESTVLYACLNSECCIKPPTMTLAVECRATEGYRGVLCGDCAMADGYIRSGDACQQCLHLALSVLCVIALALGAVGALVYYAAFMSFDAGDSTNTTGVTFKLLMSYNQMLSILGIFKARGTAIFRQYTQWPTSIAGGGITKALFVKCTFHSTLYGPFMLTMVTPIVALVATCAILWPTTKWERGKEARRELAGVLVDAPETRARLLPVLRAGGGFDRAVATKAAWWPRIALEEEEKAEWIADKAAKRQHRFSPCRRLASVAVFVLFSLYPTLIQASVSVLRCTEPIEGVRYVVEDLAKKCYTPQHIFFAIIGVIGIFIYALGA